MQFLCGQDSIFCDSHDRLPQDIYVRLLDGVQVWKTWRDPSAAKLPSATATIIVSDDQEVHRCQG